MWKWAFLATEPLLGWRSQRRLGVVLGNGPAVPSGSFCCTGGGSAPKEDLHSWVPKTQPVTEQEPYCCTQPGPGMPGPSCTFSLPHAHQGAFSAPGQGSLHLLELLHPHYTHTHGLAANIPPRNPRMGLFLALF